MKSYKELEVWQKAVDLTVAIYKATENFPSAEKFGLISQMRRAAGSVPANIAEGWVQFLLIARGSLMELETHLIIANRLTYLSQDQLEQRLEDVQIVGKMLNALIQSLKLRLR